DAAANWSSTANALNYTVISNSITFTNMITTSNGVPITNQVAVTNARSKPITFWSAPSALGFHQVTAIAIDPVEPSTVYAGTSGGSIYDSTDSGATWSRLFSFNTNVNALLVEPSMPGTLYAGTS